MNKPRFIFSAAGLLAMFLSSVSFASASSTFNFDNFRPYIGVDAQSRDMKFEDAFGGNIFKEHYPQYDVYGGIRLFRYFAINVGYQESKTKDRTAILGDGDTYLGILIPAGFGTEAHYTEAKIKGAHLDLVGFLPICPRLDVDILASVGVVRNKLSLTDIQTAADNIALPQPIVQTYDDKDTHARVSLGIQKTFYQRVGIRALVTWEDTSRFDDLKPIQSPSALTNVKIEDSLIYSLGIFFIV